MKTEKTFLIMGCILLALLIGGCTTPQPRTDVDEQLVNIQKQESNLAAMQDKLDNQEKNLSEAQRKLNMRAQQLEKRAYMVDQKEAQISDKEMELAGMKKGSEEDMASLFPPNAKPGECYARVFVPSAYEYKTETFLKHDAKSEVVVIPPKYKTVEKQVLVKEASKKLEIIPAQYEWVEEKVLISPEKRELLPVPAKYETKTEKVLVRAEHTEWKKGKGPIQKVNQTTGEIMCLVTEPAIYKTITKRVLKENPTTREVIIPAKYEIVKKKVMTSPPQTKVIEIPAVYKMVNVTKLVETARTETRTTPAEYQDVTRKVMVSPGHLEWQQILCQTNMTQVRTTEIQHALKGAGYDPGPVDGAIGPQTMTAVNKYQMEKGLPVTKYLTFEILESLGVTP